MGKNNINLASISDVEVREDGEEIKLTFIGGNRQGVTVTLKLLQIDSVIESLIEIASSGKLNRALANTEPKPKRPTQFNPLSAPVLLTREFEGASYEAGGLSLRVTSMRDDKVQIDFRPEQVERLFQILMNVHPLKGDETTH